MSANFEFRNRGWSMADSNRSLRATSASARRRAQAQVQLLAYFTRVLDHRVRLPAPSVPRYELTLSAEDPDVERVAEAVRKAWGLPPGPIEHMVRNSRTPRC